MGVYAAYRPLGFGVADAGDQDFAQPSRASGSLDCELWCRQRSDRCGSR